uniref:Uncharacterized protein n=1 Tax=Arundo donax TaxID=35708 RepID=A0A0A9CJF5_ARUDO
MTSYLVFSVQPVDPVCGRAWSKSHQLVR